MKTKIILIVVLIIIVGLFAFNYHSVPENVEQAVVTEVSDQDVASESSSDGENMMMESEKEMENVEDFKMIFTGYGPAGKVHEGSFDSQSFVVARDESGEIVSGKMTIAVNTVQTGISDLDAHLCNEDFFMCETHPESTFALNSVEKISDTEYNFGGVMNLKGVDKQVTFKATRAENKYSGEFLLNVNEFDFGFKAIDENVLVSFSFTL